MKLHSRNRKRKLDTFLGGQSEGAGTPYSLSFADDVGGNTGSSMGSKRLKMNGAGGFSQAVEDDDIEIISFT
jgi:hypothetical protein